MTGTGDLAADFKARVAQLAAIARRSGNVIDDTTTCTACHGSGWATLIREGERVGTAYACLCDVGQQKGPTVKTVRDVATAAELAELFPQGIPARVLNTAVKLEAAGVGRAESRYTLDSFAQRFANDKVAERHLNVARLWVDTTSDKRSDLVLFGSHGRGKTGLTVGIARALVDRGEHVLFTEAETIAARIRGTYRRTGDDGRYDPSDRDVETEADIVGELTSVATLIIDEVTGVKLSEFVDDKLRLIVAARQKNLRPTILTLNVDATIAGDPQAIEEALARMLGPALYDRLAERAQWLAMFGASTRGRR